MDQPESPDCGRVIVVGSSNWDRTAYVPAFPVPGETMLIACLEESMGGKGANQAVAARINGADVLFLTALGDDSEGQRITAELGTHGVSVVAMAPVDGLRTGAAFITVDHHGENQILVAPGANQGHSEEVTDEALAKAGHWASAGGDAVVVTQAEIAAAAIGAAAAFAEASDYRFVLNLAPYRELPDDVIGIADPLVVNLGEATALLRSRKHLGGDADLAPEDLCRLLGSMSRSVVVTLGARGAVAIDQGEFVAVAAPKIERVVDTTGAGDAFVGALAASLARRDSLGGALAVASNFSAQTVTRRGAAGSYLPLLKEGQHE